MRFLKSLLVVVVLRLGGFPALSQGTVDFENNLVFVTPADRYVRDMNGALLVGTNYSAQLYYGSANAPEMELISVSHAPVPFRSSTTSVPGTWNASADRIRTLEGFPVGSAVTLQVRVWDATVGSSWEQAMSQGFGGTQYGASNPFQYFVQVEGCQPVTCYYMDNLRGFMLVPEPSVIALAVLGAGGFLLLRRRK